MLSLMERGRASMERLEGILKVEPAIASPAAPVGWPDFRQGVEFRNVGFSYSQPLNGRSVLREINLQLPRGRILAIVGRTGAGKTSLVQLLARLYDVSAGEIKIDGRDIRLLSLGELRRNLGVVPQDPFLFSTTLRRNLTFGRDGISEEEIQDAVQIANLDRDIDLFTQGLDTVVGERGVTLSGGQKQRATLARALLLDAPILILDDCLSSVDAETEERILKGLKNILKEKTCIIVSHRISAIRNADEIVVVEDGEIVERGNHQSLLAQGGVYAELLRRQQLAEELEHLS
jgi:ATP-binding cassette subfamily B protein